MVLPSYGEQPTALPGSREQHVTLPGCKLEPIALSNLGVYLEPAWS